MQITITNGAIRQPWGRLSIADTKNAADILSAQSFRAWILLALNQDGYRWTGELEPEVTRELGRRGYLVPLDDGNMIFDPSGDAVATTVPTEWQELSRLYGVGGMDYRAVADKLAGWGLIAETDEILSYWLTHYNELQLINHSKTKNPILYDLAIAAARWARDTFALGVGDVIEVGADGRQLRYNDDRLAVQVRTQICNKGQRSVKISNDNLDAWNRAIRQGKVEIPLPQIGKILGARR